MSAPVWTYLLAADGNIPTPLAVGSKARGNAQYMAAGTGKTLVARAVAASASRAGRKVSFFMRKGADILSKWVGEAERQLRLLFEEAQRQQPAIIFFDEIDGLAPVRCHPSRLRTQAPFLAHHPHCCVVPAA